jgi:hypothetical protein
MISHKSEIPALHRQLAVAVCVELLEPRGEDNGLSNGRRHEQQARGQWERESFHRGLVSGGRVGLPITESLISSRR